MWYFVYKWLEEWLSGQWFCRTLRYYSIEAPSVLIWLDLRHSLFKNAQGVFAKTGALRTKRIEECCIKIAAPVRSAWRILPLFCKVPTLSCFCFYGMVSQLSVFSQQCFQGNVLKSHEVIPARAGRQVYHTDERWKHLLSNLEAKAPMLGNRTMTYTWYLMIVPLN